MPGSADRAVYCVEKAGEVMAAESGYTWRQVSPASFSGIGAPRLPLALRRISTTTLMRRGANRRTCSILGLLVVLF